MKQQYLLWGAGLALLLTGCIDNDYDLSDIDTTSQFRVNNLTIPVNLETVVLSDIIKVEEGDRLEEVTINGNTFYAVTQEGVFNSDGIIINSFEANHGMIEPKEAVFKISEPESARRKAEETVVTGTYLLTEDINEDLNYVAETINGSLRVLTDIYFKDLIFEIILTTNSLPDNDNWSSSFYNLDLSIPIGLNVIDIKAGETSYSPSAYNPITGVISLPEIKLVHNNADIRIIANALNIEGYKDRPFVPSKDPCSDTGTFSLKTHFNIDKGAQLKITGPSDELAQIREIAYRVDYNLDELQATSILGDIYYDLKGTGLNIDPINLENMPSFLDDPETDLIISNPQIYLDLMNPIGRYGLSYQSSLDIIAKRLHQDNSFRSPEIVVPNREGRFNYLLAPYPDKVTNIPSGFEPIAPENKLTYVNLGNLLSGEGLPETLDIEIVNPEVPQQTVTSPFLLDQTIDGMEGRYTFLAPLSLKEGSTIVKTVDGWWTEDLSDLNIEYLSILADATNGLSTGVILNLYAIDRDGNQISSEGSLKLDENAVNTPIEIKLEGLEPGKPFNNLDGIQLYVIAGSNNGQPLAPDQIINLDNLKAKVTGFYTKKL